MKLYSKYSSIFGSPTNDTPGSIVFNKGNHSQISLGFEEIKTHISISGKRTGKMRVISIIGKTGKNIAIDRIDIF